MTAITALCGRNAQAYDPESEEVKVIAKRAVEFLRSNGGKQNAALGGHALRGLAILKATDDPKDPDVLPEVAHVA